jgi:uncharacterized protein (TIGR02246 family)
MLRTTLRLGLVTLVLAACGGEPAEEAAPVEDSGAAMASADEAALDEVATYWETHYNMGHPDMVASVYTDDAWALPAGGGALQGPAAIEADLAAGMEGGTQASINTLETMVMGDMGVMMGTYTIAVDMDGMAMETGGAWMNLMVRDGDSWKIAVNISNYDSPRPEGWEWNPPFEGEVEEASTMGATHERFEASWASADPAMLASGYAEDAMIAFSEGPILSGRDAIVAELSSRIAEGSTVDIHGVGTVDLGDGWAVDGGWWEVMVPGMEGPARMGNFLNLVQQQADGTWQTVRGVTNVAPPPAM